MPNTLSPLPVVAQAAQPARTRAQCWEEELANAASHGAGALLAAGCSPWAIAKAMAVGALHGVGAIVFCATMVLLFTVSCIYHAARDHGFKRTLQKLDHAAIFLFIAGTYTPFLLGVLADNGGPWVLAGVWFVALLGVGAKLTDRIRHPLLSTLLYVGMGWGAAFMLGPLAEEIPRTGLALIVAGGLLYTVGAVVFHFDHRIRYGHLLWHVLVLAACACHFVAVAQFAFP
jgi:hemolysin III